jgi:MraZ protein
MLLPALNADLTLDPKGRLMLPRMLRTALEAQGINRLVAFASAGPRGGLAVMRIDHFDSMASELQAGGPMNPKARLFSLAISSTAQTVTVDGNGRLLVPPTLRRLLGLERELYLYTSGSWFEVWDRDRWANQAYTQAAAMWDELYGLASLTGTDAGVSGEVE